MRTVSVSSADRVWVWLGDLVRVSSPPHACFSILGGSSVGVATALHFADECWRMFQYPRRIECGCGPSCCARTPSRVPPFSILGGSSVGVASFKKIVDYKFARFQYPRRIECGCGPCSESLRCRSQRLSVSSADRVWVWPRAARRIRDAARPFSILGGSSVGVAVSVTES